MMRAEPRTAGTGASAERVTARALNAELAAALASGKLGAELVRVARIAAAMHRGMATARAHGPALSRRDGAGEGA